jgi:crotonobetainyl-CoA:carnitine CoA-transferase CaiB-like acyl-CoA transferase
MGALDGVRVLDLSWGIAGPMAGLLLAEQGADVVKVEPPGGDPFRAYDGYKAWNRSRRSVIVDLKQPEGRDAFDRLAATADVVLESFSPGVADRLGVGPAALRERCPRLVYCSIPAYPPGHRRAVRPGWDALVQASVGVQWEQPAWRPGPSFLHVPVPSMGAMFLAVIGITSALVDRERTGQGEELSVSLYEGALMLTTQIWQEVERSPEHHAVMEKTYPMGVHAASIFQTGDGRWIHAATMAGGQPTRTEEEILGMPPIAGGMFTVTDAKRDAFGRQPDRDALVDEYHAAGLGAERIEASEAMFTHPQVIANGMVVEVDDPELGPTVQLGPPAVLPDVPPHVVGPQPAAGQHTRAVLREVGYDDAEINALVELHAVEER